MITLRGPNGEVAKVPVSAYFAGGAGWGSWHVGDVYSVRVWHSGYDCYPNNNYTTVEIRDAAGVVIRRQGKVIFCGNFSPVFVTVNGKRLTIEKIVDLTKPF